MVFICHFDFLKFNNNMTISYIYYFYSYASQRRFLAPWDWPTEESIQQMYGAWNKAKKNTAATANIVRNLNAAQAKDDARNMATDNYDTYKNPGLQLLCKDRHLQVGGNKDALLARLRAFDAKQLVEEADRDDATQTKNNLREMAIDEYDPMANAGLHALCTERQLSAEGGRDALLARLRSNDVDAAEAAELARKSTAGVELERDDGNLEEETPKFQDMEERFEENVGGDECG